MSMGKPTARELDTFCSAVIDGNNHTDAFYVAFPNSKANRNTAKVEAYRFTGKSGFAETLQRLLEIESALMASHRYGMRGSRIGLLAEIACKAFEDGRYADAINAIKELNKMQDSNEEVQNNRTKQIDTSDVPQVILSHNTTLLPGRG